MHIHEPLPKQHIGRHKHLLLPWIAITSTLTFVLLIAHELGY